MIQQSWTHKHYAESVQDQDSGLSVQTQKRKLSRCPAELLLQLMIRQEQTRVHSNNLSRRFTGVG